MKVVFTELITDWDSGETTLDAYGLEVSDDIQDLTDEEIEHIIEEELGI